jgi:hypothetical protein
MIDHAGKPFPLLGQEAGVLPIAAPVLQIDFLMRDIPVTAQHDLSPGIAESVQRIDATLHETELDGETLR